MNPKSERNSEKLNKDFIEHLENASRIVAAWPGWKQSVLGSSKESCQTEGPSNSKRPMKVMKTP